MTNTPQKNGIALLSQIEPKNFTQTSEDPHWIKTMEGEMYQIEKNGTSEVSSKG